MKRVLIIGRDGQVEETLTPSTITRRASATNRSGKDLGTPAAVAPEFDVVLVDRRAGETVVATAASRIRRDYPFMLVAGCGDNPQILDSLYSALWIRQKAAKSTSITVNQDESTVILPSEVECHAIARWAGAIVAAIISPRDPKTLAAWADRAAASRGTLRNWCRTAGLPPRRSLLFARLLRAVMLRPQGVTHLEEALDVVDKRTLRKHLRIAGFPGTEPFTITDDVDTFLANQQLISNPVALAAIRNRLAAAMGNHGEDTGKRVATQLER